jgi:hypothetical protein
MKNLHRMGGGAGILAAIAAAWLVVGLAVVFPAVGLGLNVQANPNKYLPLIAKHQIAFWMVNVLGGLAAALLAFVLLLALADRFRDEAPGRAQIALAMGVVGVMGFAIGAFLKQVGLGYLAVLHHSNPNGAAIAFYAVEGTAGAFQALGGVALGLGALVFGSVMLGTSDYGPVGYLSVVVGMPLIMSAFAPQPIVLLIAALLAIAWLTWTGVLLWREGAPADDAGRRTGDGRAMAGSLKVMNRGHGERRAI